MNAQDHREQAEVWLKYAEKKALLVMESRDAIDSVSECRHEKDRDYGIARATVHAILAKGWN
jgi:hypothetical protein